MPTDKAFGPDGFNGLFMKKCWHIIKEDVYQLCFDFFDGKIDLWAINSSFITMVLKVNNPLVVNDFRLISLMNSILKIITKLLGDRLQSIILPWHTKISMASSKQEPFKTVWAGLSNTSTNVNSPRRR
jgi:hypothetical protein